MLTVSASGFPLFFSWMNFQKICATPIGLLPYEGLKKGSKEKPPLERDGMAAIGLTFFARNRLSSGILMAIWSPACAAEIHGSAKDSPFSDPNLNPGE